MEEKIMSDYVKTGTLPKPGYIGRTIRLLLGVYLLYSVYRIASAPPSGLINALPESIGLWVAILFAFWVFPEVLNIGWSLKRGYWPRVVILILAVLAALWGVVQYGSFMAPPLSWLVYVWLLYTFGHLGIAFVIASVIATPGCEMRSIPHLWTLLTGKKTAEHFCPGFIDNIDKWETGKSPKEFS